LQREEAAQRFQRLDILPSIENPVTGRLAGYAKVGTGQRPGVSTRTTDWRRQKMNGARVQHRLPEVLIGK
jgi:hypothetical protein